MAKSIKGTRTEQNLLKSFAGESQARNRYADFEKIARDEGFSEVAESFKQIAKVERFHEARYRKLSSNLKANTVFKKKESTKWHCRNCGYVFEGTEAPKECPACKHPQAYYEVLAENY